MRAYCTYFDRNYLVRGLALLHSLKRHETQPYRCFVVCMDEFTRIMLERLRLPNVVLVPMHAIEAGDTELLATRENRSVQEYLWTTTPTIILRLLERNRDVDVLTYLDADQLFYSSPDPIFADLGKGSVLIHEHRFPQRLAHNIVHGRFNVGLMCFRRNSVALEVLAWWRERCIEWCYCKVEEHRFGDQKYLDDWLTRFQGIVSCENPGVGLAPWNHEQYRYSVTSEGIPLVDGRPIVLYHFHSLSFITPHVIVPLPDVNYVIPEGVLKLCLYPYAVALDKAQLELRSVYPTFEFGLKKDLPLTGRQTFLVRKDTASAIQMPAGLPALKEIGPNWLAYCSPQVQA